MQQPTIINQPSAALTEAAKAKWWRKNVIKLSRNELAQRTGYSPQAIQMFEQGYRQTGVPIKERAWRRYRAVCGSLHLPAQFDWRDPEASWGDYEVSGRPSQTVKDRAIVAADGEPIRPLPDPKQRAV